MTSHPTTPDGAVTAGPTEIGPWRTSSYSGNGQNCVEVALWCTSGHSGNGENCVEVARPASGVLLRDTKDHGTGPVLSFTAAQWTLFLQETLSDATSTNGAVTVAHTSEGTEIRTADGATALRFTPDEWAAFRNGVREQEFDTLAAG